MKYIQLMRSVIFILLLTIAQTVSSQNTFNSNEARWKYVLTLAQKYSPAAYKILSETKDPDHYYHYMGNASTKLDLLSHFGTLVHEAGHGFNFYASEDFEYESYLDGSGEILSVKRGLLYNSNRLNRIVSKELQEYIFRYSTYVGDSSNLSSQVDGIYGLLDEFDCYFIETKLGMDIRKEYESLLGPKDADGWVENYIGGVSSEVTAFYEFRLFFGWYLTYAKKYQPKVYADLLANTELRKTLTKLYDQFEVQAKRYDVEIARVSKDLNANGVKAVVEEDWFKIYTSEGSWSGYGVNTSYVQRLTEEFDKEGKAVLTAFRLE